MRTRWVVPILLSLSLVACNESSTASKSDESRSEVKTASTTSGDLTPEELGELGAKIANESSNAKKLLSERGLDEKSFEEKIRKVTEDPEASKRYAAAYEKAKKS